jgi:hypothetical protein
LAQEGLDGRTPSGLIGIDHNVSRECLQRYLWQFDFLWNHRQLNDGERTIAAIKSAESLTSAAQGPTCGAGVY